jgi:hypothetical protein
MDIPYKKRGSLPEYCKHPTKPAFLIAVSCFLACVLTLARPATSAAAAAGTAEGATGGQISLPAGMGWEDWHAVRDQHAHRATVKVFVRNGEAPQTAKVRVVLAQTPKPTFDSPQAIVDSIVQTANRQCEKATVRPIRKSASDLIFELRGYGCSGQKGERYLLQRIAFIGEWELQVTYAPMSPTDDLPPPDKERALKLLSSATIVPGSSPAAETGWFLITPPPQADGHYDASAPISKWKIEEGAGTREKCKEVQTFLTLRARKEGKPSEIEEVKDASCVSMDDPRLEGN